MASLIGRQPVVPFHFTERVHPKKVVGHAARLSDLRSQKS
jgi:hypothetical protein